MGCPHCSVGVAVTQDEHVPVLKFFQIKVLRPPEYISTLLYQFSRFKSFYLELS